ncbi:hypothetical protein QBC38DRAFT_493000 [Podospora fimiseda]|uniref:Uncharacterized protein n=1 Tax=Podospora fimiseda TaxID=252190 RepID=A0AAN7BF09_9PEZI|nr:hypothetical protein QBC38DRAFT_493000 [Podospora fimiseda]
MALVESGRYNELPSLEEANDRREAEGMNELINSRLRELFIRHGAQTAFTLYLAHRHHQLNQGEAIVKVNGTAHLMSTEAMQDIQAVGNKIVPTTWMGPDMIPMEFAVVPNTEEVQIPDPAFAAELASALASVGYKGLFGIDTLDKQDWTELKICDASVVVPSNGNESDEAYIPVAFAFDDKTPGFKVHGKCKKEHKHTSKP